jgi:SAM-dependent methyltransferase
MNPARPDSVRIADHWSAERSWQIGQGLYWLELAAVQQRLNLKVSGRPDTDWIAHTLARHLAERLPLERCLSLGCGEGGLERRLASLGTFQRCDAYDIAPGAINKARTEAAAAGYGHIQYTVCDLNESDLPVGQYDAVWASGAVHHVDRLEHLFAQVGRALKPDGLFILNEYVGPNRFQFPPRQRQIIQNCHALLPEACRRLTIQTVDQHRTVSQGHGYRGLARRVVDRLRDGDLIEAVRRQIAKGRSLRAGTRPVRGWPNLPSASSVRATDPSEAVRSADILPLLRQYFAITEFKPLGGAILQFLLADIAGNFQDAAGERLLGTLFTIEDALMDCGDLNSDFAYIVAVQKPDDRAQAPAITGHVP